MIVSIPEVLREKLGPDGARALADLLNEASVQTRGDVIEIAASRYERRLAEEIGKLRAEFGGLQGALESQIASLRGEMDSKLGQLRGDLRGEIGDSEGRIIRWMFVFWLGQMAALAGILFGLLGT